MKRRHDQLPLRKPLRSELLHLDTLTAHEGGLGGTNVDIEEEVSNWKSTAPAHRQAVNRDLNIDWLIKKELKRTIHTLERTKKEKQHQNGPAPQSCYS